MNEYTENIAIKMGVDPASMKDIEQLQAKLEGIAEDKKIKWEFDESDVDASIQKLFKKYKWDPINPRQWARALKEAEKDATSKSVRRFLTGDENGEITKETVTAHGVEKFREGISKGLTTLIGVNESGFGALTSLAKDAWSELQSLVEYSKLSTKDVREQMFTYGFTFAENYAFDKTMGLLRLDDIEDVWYLNDQEQQKFREKFAEYTERYNQLYDQGFFEDMQEYNWEMEEFKEDLRYSIIQWMVDNKDIIKSGMEAIMTIAKWVLKIFGAILGSGGTVTESEKSDKTSEILNTYKNYYENVSNVSESEKAAKTAEILNTYSNHYENISNVSNVKVDVGGVTNNYARPGVDTATTNPAEMTYRQILQVLNGRRYA